MRRYVTEYLWSTADKVANKATDGLFKGLHTNPVGR